VQHVTEDALLALTPGFLPTKMWCRQRRTWWALPSRHLGDGAEVQKQTECRHVSLLLLDGEKRCSRRWIQAKEKKGTCLR
jgi:hypothetical protein